MRNWGEKIIVIEPYVELTRMIERMHRRLLDVVRVQLNEMNISDITPVQALLLANIEGEDVLFRDLVERGYYLGSNASYNIKKLVDGGYLKQERSSFDKRSVRIRLAEKGQALCQKLLEANITASKVFNEKAESGVNLTTACQTLRQLERMWADYIHYGHL